MDNYIYILYFFNKYFKKLYCLIIIFFSIFIFKNFLKINNIRLINEYLKFKNKFNLKLNYKLNKELRIGIYGYCLKNGGRARITSLLVNYFEKVKFFRIFLFTRKEKQDNEYYIPRNIKRTIIKNNLLKNINKNKINLLIYELNNDYEIKILNNLKSTKIIFYMHASIFYFIYSNFTFFKELYKCYKNSKYIYSINNSF